MPSKLGNSLDINQNSIAVISPLLTDNTKPKLALFLANVECNALVTGRPLQLARYIRESLTQNLASSGNFAVVETSRAARYLIEVKISSFERGIENHSDKRTANVVLEVSQEHGKRRGILELQVAVTDRRIGKVIHGFSATSQMEDVTSTKRSGLLGFTAVGESYQRKPDSAVVSEATRKVALELWARLVAATEPLSRIHKQQ